MTVILIEKKNNFSVLLKDKLEFLHCHFIFIFKKLKTKKSPTRFEQMSYFLLELEVGAGGYFRFSGNATGFYFSLSRVLLPQ